MLSLRDAMRSHPAMRGSVGQVVDKGYLRELMDGDEEIAAVMHLDSTAEQLRRLWETRAIQARMVL